MPGLAIINARVITVDPSDTVAEVVVCEGDRISAVGTYRAVEITPGTPVIDAGGKAVIPGLIDGHAHLDREGLKDIFPSLEGCRCIRDVLDRIERIAAGKSPSEWIVTMPVGDPPYYWNVPGCLAENRFPTRFELDEVAPGNPVYIRPIWGYWRHQLPLESVANSAALELAGIGRDSIPDSSTINFEQDANGELTGLIRETTYMPVVELRYFHMAPGFSHEDRVSGIGKAMRIYNATGTTSVLEEHGAAQELISAWRTVRENGQSTVRSSLVFSPSWGGALDIDYADVFGRWAAWLGGRGLGDDWLRVFGMFTDTGVDLDARLRATAAPYTGWSGFNYDNGVPENRMTEFLVEAARADIRIAVIGPRFLDMFEKVNRTVPITDKRWIVGHLDVMDERAINQAADLGVVMTTHTNRYIHKHGGVLRQELGPDRENDIVPLRRLLEAGVRVGLATDNVPTSLFHAIWHTVARMSLTSEELIAPDQALSPLEALRCATLGGAHLTFEEDLKGSIEVGKLADLVILSDNPLTCANETLKDIVAETTIVGGKVVYQRATA